MKCYLSSVKQNTLSYELVITTSNKKISKLKPNSTIDIEIEQLKEKRSLSQNSYAWVLVGKIAEKLNECKEDIYFNLLKSYGQSSLVAVKNNELDKLKRSVKYYEIEDERNNFTYVKIYAGTSIYNKEEMKIFLDGVIQEAEQLDIVTLTPQEIERLGV